MGDDIEVIQGVGVLGVTEDGDDLHVDIYGGDCNACGTIRFTFAEHVERAATRRLLDRWRRDGTAVTYVSTGTTIALQNDRTLFGDSLEENALH